MKIEDAVRKSGGVWPKRLLSKGSIGVMLWLDSDGGITVCTRTEFEECTRRLRNEPSFDDHPDAKCFAQNSKGKWYKNTLTRDANHDSFGGWHTVSGENNWKFVSKGEVIGDWRDTLRLRPEEKKTEDKNDWYKKGEFPPVGTECRIKRAGKDFEEGALMYLSEDILVWRYNTGDEVAFVSSSCSFQPLQTERERWIEAARKAVIEAGAYMDALASIYDAGLAKMPEDK